MQRTRRTRFLVATLTGVALCACEAQPGAPASPPQATEAQLQALRASLAEALAVKDRYQRVQQIATLVADVPPGSAAELQQALVRGGKHGIGVMEFELLARAWAKQQPQEAFHWVLGASGARDRVSALAIVVEEWAKVDPSAAAAGIVWALQTPDREVSQALQQGLVRGWFQKDRAGLEKYIEDLGSGPEQQRSIVTYATSLFQRERADGLIRWAEAIPDEKASYKRAVFPQVGTVLALGDPPAAERFCEAHCEKPYGRSLRTVIVRVRLHNSESGAAVMDWVTGTPESDSQLHALQVGYQLWGGKDLTEAVDWMQQKLAEEPQPPWISKLYGPYALVLSRRSPVEAIPWAERMEPESVRKEFLVRLARKWRREDPAAADAWIEKSALDEKERAAARDLGKPDYLPKLNPPIL
jgi:hypothetical protein